MAALRKILLPRFGEGKATPGLVTGTSPELGREDEEFGGYSLAARPRGVVSTAPGSSWVLRLEAGIMSNPLLLLSAFQRCAPENGCGYDESRAGFIFAECAFRSCDVSRFSDGRQEIFSIFRAPRRGDGWAGFRGDDGIMNSALFRVFGPSAEIESSSGGAPWKMD